MIFFAVLLHVHSYYIYVMRWRLYWVRKCECDFEQSLICRQHRGVRLLSMWSNITIQIKRCRHKGDLQFLNNDFITCTCDGAHNKRSAVKESKLEIWSVEKNGDAFGYLLVFTDYSVIHRIHLYTCHYKVSILRFELKHRVNQFILNIFEFWYFIRCIRFYR